MKLISMTDFVLEQMENVMSDGTGAVCAKIGNYARFLKQPLKLEMFVPCDKDGNVLREPTWNLVKNMPLTSEGWDSKFYRLKEDYYKAKEKVLFEGFEYDDISCFEYFITNKLINEHIIEIFHYTGTHIIEDLVKYNLKLTPTAIKQWSH